MSALSPEKSELGKKTIYPSAYNPQLLFPILRATKRAELGIEPGLLPFKGYDCWNHYEVSWLNERGKPLVAIAQLVFDCESACLIESKSMKLYFNSLNNVTFKNSHELANCIKSDLEQRATSTVAVSILPLDSFNGTRLHSSLGGNSIDDLDVTCSQYITDPTLLITKEEIVTETLHSHLLKSNCLMTGQPDWGSVEIAYTGKKICHESLLQYIVSYRNHTEFGEHCTERLYTDLWRYCQPASLTVLTQYTRRGGIDIMSVRSSQTIAFDALKYRLCRQ